MEGARILNDRLASADCWAVECRVGVGRGWGWGGVVLLDW